MIDLSIVQDLYDNTLYMAYRTSNPLASEDVCNELGALLGTRSIADEEVDTDYVICMLNFIWQFDSDYSHMYIASRTVTDLDVRYEIAFTNSKKGFEVRIAKDKRDENHFVGLVMKNFMKAEDRKDVDISESK